MTTTNKTQGTTQTPNTDATKAQTLANAATNAQPPKVRDYAAEYNKAQLTSGKAQIVMNWLAASKKDDTITPPTEQQIVDAVKAQMQQTAADTAAADKEIRAELAKARKEAAETAAAVQLGNVKATSRLRTDDEIVKNACKTLDDAHQQAQTALVTGEFGPRHALKAAVVAMREGTSVIAGQAAVLSGDMRSLTGKRGPRILAGLYAPTK